MKMTMDLYTHVTVTSRKGRVSRNTLVPHITGVQIVTSRKGRVSRNAIEVLIDINLPMSRPVRGV